IRRPARRRRSTCIRRATTACSCRISAPRSTPSSPAACTSPCAMPRRISSPVSSRPPRRATPTRSTRNWLRAPSRARTTWRRASSRRIARRSAATRSRIAGNLTQGGTHTMSCSRLVQYTVAGAGVAAVAGSGVRTHGQAAPTPTNEAPNPYQSVENFFKLPEGRTWGSTSAIEIDKDGKTVWIAERCGANSCLDRASGQMSTSDTILHFDQNGKLIKSFGAGMLIFPHGIHVDRDGNVWVTDGQDSAPLPQRGAGAGARGAGAGAAAGARGPAGPREGATKGNQVYKFSPDGKLLLTLGKPGGAASPEYFYQPNDVVTAQN